MAMLLQRVKDIGGWVPRDMILLVQKFSLDTGISISCDFSYFLAPRAL